MLSIKFGFIEVHRHIASSLYYKKNDISCICVPYFMRSSFYFTLFAHPYRRLPSEINDQINPNVFTLQRD